MALFPEVQRKAQAELDLVVGQDRLPDFDDIEELPYLRAIVKEVLRWRPVLPLSVPHVSIEDDVYNGYHIPKGTIIIPVRSIVFYYSAVLRLIPISPYRTSGGYSLRPPLAVLMTDRSENRSMLRNPTDYPDPDCFRPERYLNADNTENLEVRDPVSVVFGHGRR